MNERYNLRMRYWLFRALDAGWSSPDKKLHVSPDEFAEMCDLYHQKVQERIKRGEIRAEDFRELEEVGSRIQTYSGRQIEIVVDYEKVRSTQDPGNSGSIEDAREKRS